MMLGRAEKAGSGVDKILSGWNDLGWSTPVLTEELQPDYVVLTLPVGKAKTHQENPSRNSKMSSKVEAKIKLILEFCSEPKSFIEIMEHIGLKDRVSFKRLYIQRMLDEGLLKMTNPDNPTSRNQMYVTQK